MESFLVCQPHGHDFCQGILWWCRRHYHQLLPWQQHAPHYIFSMVAHAPFSLSHLDHHRLLRACTWYGRLCYLPRPPTLHPLSFNPAPRCSQLLLNITPSEPSPLTLSLLQSAWCTRRLVPSHHLSSFLSFLLPLRSRNRPTPDNLVCHRDRVAEVTLGGSPMATGHRSFQSDCELTFFGQFCCKRGSQCWITSSTFPY